MSDQFAKLESAIREGDVETGVKEAVSLIEGGTKPGVIFTECIEPVLATIGEQFSRLEIFLPEMINSAEVVKGIQKAALPYLEADQTASQKGKVVIATVSGDLHDIGKNIVKAMLEVNGFEVKDLGVDASPRAIMTEAKEFNADLIALSALMLPSLPFVKDVIEIVESDDESRARFKVIVGGGPVSQGWADEAGADGYGDNAIDAVKVAHQLVGAR